MTTTILRTSLYDAHLALGARTVPFGGWEMPVQYSGILAEVRAVRTATGLFDVSHMGRLYISGERATEFLDWVLTGSAENLSVGRARYCMVCNEAGGVIDDIIFYRLANDRYLLICNAGNRTNVVQWFRHWIDAKFPGGCTMDDRTPETALIAFQGPATPQAMDAIFDWHPSGLRPFSFETGDFLGIPVMAARTGYTGEDGFEIVTEAADALTIWQTLLDSGAVPCGLGARDVLRLEAALPLHGHEIGQDSTPIEAGLERFVRLDKEFVGADALRQQQERGTERKLIGLKLPGRSAPRAGYTVLDQGQKIGIITSGSYSPTLDTCIAMGYVQVRYAATGLHLDVDIRGRTTRAVVASLPFYTRPRRSKP